MQTAQQLFESAQAESAKNLRALAEKWSNPTGEGDILDIKKLQESVSVSKFNTTLQLLENEAKALKEDVNVTSQIKGYDPVLISMVRRMTPQLIAYDVCGVQPMNMPTGLGFAIRALYPNAASPQFNATSKEALFKEVNTAHSGTGTDDRSDNPFTDVDLLAKTGHGMDTPTGETAAWKNMGITIDKIALEAKTRQLRADYSFELEKDMQAVHNLSARAELSNILAQEIVLEQNQEIVRTIMHAAHIGAQNQATAGTFDYATGTDGRWAGEKALGLWAYIRSEAARLYLENRRGAGNFIITSMGVANALQLAGILKNDTNYAQSIDINLQSSTYVGMAGQLKVFVDPFLTHDGVVIGYKGANEFDAGVIYAPYVPLTMHSGLDASNDRFRNAIGFQQRAAIAANPFTSLEKGKNIYYSKFAISNLPW